MRRSICIEIVANDMRSVLPKLTTESIGIDTIVVSIAECYHHSEVLTTQTGATK